MCVGEVIYFLPVKPCFQFWKVQATTMMVVPAIKEPQVMAKTEPFLNGMFSQSYNRKESKEKLGQWVTFIIEEAKKQLF